MYKDIELKVSLTLTIGIKKILYNHISKELRDSTYIIDSIDRKALNYIYDVCRYFDNSLLIANYSTDYISKLEVYTKELCRMLDIDDLDSYTHYNIEMEK